MNYIIRISPLDIKDGLPQIFSRRPTDIFTCNASLLAYYNQAIAVVGYLSRVVTNVIPIKRIARQMGKCWRLHGQGIYVSERKM
jgi:hypothetical protein